MVDSPKQIDTTAARAYEDYMVPALFGPWVEDAMALACLRPGERVLDVACGTGTATYVAATRVTPRGSVAGLDVDPAMIEVARWKPFPPEAAPVTWHCESALAMSFRDGSFDVVLCLQGLQFFPDRITGLKEMRRVLTAVGRFVVSVWQAIEHCKGHDALAKALERHRIDAQAAQRPFSLGDAEELARLGREAGFRHVKVEAVSKVMRFPSPEDFVRSLAAGAPSTRHALAKVPDTEREQLIAEVSAELGPYTDLERPTLMSTIAQVADRSATGASPSRLTVTTALDTFHCGFPGQTQSPEGVSATVPPQRLAGPSWRQSPAGIKEIGRSVYGLSSVRSEGPHVNVITIIGNALLVLFIPGRIASQQKEGKMRIRQTLSALLTVVLCGALFAQPTVADVTISYNDYSDSPTIGRGNGTSADPNNPGYGAVRIFIEKVIEYTDEHGPDALPAGQKVVFQRNQSTGRAVNALRAGVQFANANAAPTPTVADPSWGFIFNSIPFGMNFRQTLGFLYEAKLEGFVGNGIALAQAILDSRGGTQVVFPVVGSTMQGSGYFPQPIGTPDCHAGDTECQSQGTGIGLGGLCTSGWRIRYLAPPQNIVDRACDLLVKRGGIPAKSLTFYPAVGGQSVLLPMQRRTIQGFEYVTPFDDLVDFFPVKEATPANPRGNPDAGTLNCSPVLAFPIPAGTKENCSQNIGQIGGRYAHQPSWHQPFLLSWMHVDKTVWNGLTAAQRAAVLRAAKDAVIASYHATESVQCTKLKAMLDFNAGIHQRNPDGTPRVVAGQPVSAAITLARWPDEALKVLREARDEYLASLEGPENSTQKTDAQKDFSIVLNAVKHYAASIGAIAFDPGRFPAQTGLVKGEECNLVKD